MRKTNKVFSWFFTAFLTIFLFVGLQARSTYVDTRGEIEVLGSPISKIDKIVNSYALKKQFTGVIFVTQGIKGEHIIYQNAVGMANREWKIRNGMNTKLLIGSNTKQFTAMLVMQEVEKGNIDLEGVISDYLPEYKGNGKDVVTIHQLLSMQSRIPNFNTRPDYEELPLYPGNKAYRLHFSVMDLIDRYCSDNLTIPQNGCPGSLYDYSNSNYYILGAILEKVTGKSYLELLQERIFNPLKMKNSGYYTNDVILSQKAYGYTRVNGITGQAPFIDISNAYSAGAVYSTVEDFNIWESSLYTDELLSDYYREKMMEPYIAVCPNDAAYYGISLYYGYGLEIGYMQAGHRQLNLVLHGGSIPGFVSFHLRVLNDKYTIIILANLDDKDLFVPPPYDIAINIVRVLYNLSPITIPDSVAKDLKFNW
ncbi:MAG TPA: serine hydrolase domain-containing protein [Candidatus Kapabacteria bacterium]|nr:serine hydrolase domain-containing protein [Candidatus Kapabacteria bacterium]